MKASVKTYFITGLIVIVPIAVTFWITFTLLIWIDQIFVLDKLLGTSIPGLGLIISLALIFLIGFLSHNVLGHWVVDQLSLIVNRIPFIGTIYGSLSQIMNSIVSQRGEKLGRAVLVEFPREGSWSVGFMTTRTPHPALQKVSADKMVCIFVPTTPNPTSGFFFLAPEKNVRFLDISTEEAFKIVVSLGLVSKERATAAPEANR